jgi:hypothetical protein
MRRTVSAFGVPSSRCCFSGPRYSAMHPQVDDLFSHARDHGVVGSVRLGPRPGRDVGWHGISMQCLAPDVRYHVPFPRSPSLVTGLRYRADCTKFLPGAGAMHNASAFSGASDPGEALTGSRRRREPVSIAVALALVNWLLRRHAIASHRQLARLAAVARLRPSGDSRAYGAILAFCGRQRLDATAHQRSWCGVTVRCASSGGPGARNIVRMDHHTRPLSDDPVRLVHLGPCSRWIVSPPPDGQPRVRPPPRHPPPPTLGGSKLLEVGHPRRRSPSRVGCRLLLARRRLLPPVRCRRCI